LPVLYGLGETWRVVWFWGWEMRVVGDASSTIGITIGIVVGMLNAVPFFDD